MNRILFLDIDGVLNSHAQNAAGVCGIDPACAARLNRILAVSHDTLIVLSSAWRYMVLGGELTLKGFEYLLVTHGVQAHCKLAGTTVADEVVAWRGGQILDWVRRHPGVTDWVVLDDLDIPEVGERLVRTDGKVGLTDADADRAVRILTWRRCSYCGRNPFPLAYHERGDCPEAKEA